MNLFELFVKVGVDDQASGKLKDLGGKLGNGLKTAAKIGTAAVGAAAAGITALTTAAVNNYAEYEQLVGGVETLFKGSADKVQEYAANAYKTAGMSANEYMSTVTSFSASLLQSLEGDTAKAADYADQAIRDMSDNANKMGTDMSMIQNAYQGFAKQNYTMLDNLKLGYGGTKTEMERLIKDAAALSDTVDAQSLSFGNIVEAIHVVQENMGITGTTAKEAGNTISGSVNSMKAAWSNLVTGIASGNGNINKLMGDFTSSVETAGKNILPVVKAALDGITTLIIEFGPTIVENLPTLMEEVLPGLTEAVAGMIVSLAESIPDLVEPLLTAAVQLVDQVGNAFAEKIPAMAFVFENLETVVIALTAAFVAYKAATAISGVIDALTKATEGQTIAQTLLNAVMNANPFVLVATLIAGLTTAIITLWNTNDKFKNALSDAWNWISGVAKTVWNGVANLFTTLIPNAFTSVVDWFSDIGSWFVDIGKNIVTGLWEGIQSLAGWLWDQVSGWISGLWDGICSFFGIASPSKQMKWVGKMIMEGFGLGIEGNEKKVMREVDSFAQNVMDGFGKINAPNIDASFNGSYGRADFGGEYGRKSGVVSVVQNIYSEAKTAADLMEEALYQQETAVYLGV